MNEEEKKLLINFEPRKFHSVKNPTKDLPDWFDYDYYTNDLYNEKDVNRWAFEFAVRQRDKSKDKFLYELTESYSYGYTDTKLVGELHWKNGLYVGRSGKYKMHFGNSNDSKNHASHGFGNVGTMDAILIKYLNITGGKFIPDDEINKNKDLLKTLPIKTTHSTYQLFEYSKRTGKYGHTYFPTQIDADNYEQKFNDVYHKTATFYVNLEMPTNRLINELENKIKELKNINQITDIQIPTNKVFKTWAIGLGCYDLKQYSELKNVEIQGLYLSLWQDGYQAPNNSSTDDLKKLFNRKYKPVKNMINGSWKTLTGNLP